MSFSTRTLLSKVQDTSSNMVKYRCDKCGREFPNKTHHKCLTGFQKRHLTYTRVYEDKPLFEDVDGNILELLRLIPKEEQQRVFSWRYSEYCPAPNKDIGFLGFIETYKHLSQMIPKHLTIIDIGAYGNAQSYYFTEHKKYIAVEPSCSDGRGIPMFQPSNCEIFRCTGQQFVDHILPRLRLDLDTTFVVMNYVPSSECSEVIRKTFPNLFIYYPSTSDCLL